MSTIGQQSANSADYEAYGYDANSNRLSVRLRSGDADTINFDYDNLNREILKDIPGGTSADVRMTLRVGYDPGSRLTSLTQNLSGTASDLTLGFGYTGANQVASRTISNPAYSYAPQQPNLAYQRKYDGSRRFCYDAENRLTHVRMSSGWLNCASPSAATHRLRYDALGRLMSFEIVGGATTTFLYDGDWLVAEYNGSTLLRRYVHGAGVDEPLVWYEGAGTSDRRWLAADHQGGILVRHHRQRARPP